MDRVKNEDIRVAGALKQNVKERVNQSAMKWYEHMIILDKETLIKLIWKTRGRIDGNRPIFGKVLTRWLDGVWKDLSEKDVVTRQAERCMHDGAK